MAELFEAPPVLLARPALGTSRGWIPTDYSDEVCPPCRPTPSDWLIRGDVVRLAPADEAAPSGRVLAEGDIISFDELADFPNIRAVWNGPGDYRLLSPVPAGATCFCLCSDPETLNYSIEDFMRHNGETEVFEPGEEFEIEAYDWNSHDFVLRSGRFEPITEGAHG